MKTSAIAKISQVGREIAVDYSDRISLRAAITAIPYVGGSPSFTLMIIAHITKGLF